MADLLTDEWAAEVEAAIKAGPSEEYKASKLEKYWGWVEMTGSTFAGTIAIGVSDPPPNADGAWLIVDLAGGTCRSARIGNDDDAAASDFRLFGTMADLEDLVNGYDMGKAIMYRRLQLLEAPPEKIHQFFRTVFFLRESLGCIAKTGQAAA